MTYSCAIWLDLEDRALRRTPSAVSASTSSSSSSSADSDAVKYTQTLAGAGAADAQTADEEQQEEELHEAQMRKLLRIIELADIKPGHRVRVAFLIAWLVASSRFWSRASASC